jgi:endonuclease YncB( thermonuclease family)
MRHIVRSFTNGILALVFTAVALWGISVLVGDECSTDLCCATCETLTVTRIIDGDTFDSDRGRVRLYGMDTPEIGEMCYREATERLRALARSEVKVEPGPRPRDPFDRLLFYVYTSSGESIDEILVREGLARAWERDGQHREFLLGIEAGTRESGRGCLWG